MGAQADPTVILGAVNACQVKMALKGAIEPDNVRPIQPAAADRSSRCPKSVASFTVTSAAVWIWFIAAVFTGAAQLFSYVPRDGV